MTLLGRREARWTIIGDDGHLSALSELLKQRFSAEDEGSDHAQVTIINRVVSLHGAKSTIVETRHDEGLSDIVQVLAHRDHIVAILACT